MRYCIACGQAASDDAAFCGRCGRSLTPQAAATPETTPADHVIHLPAEVGQPVSPGAPGASTVAASPTPPVAAPVTPAAPATSTAATSTAPAGAIRSLLPPVPGPEGRPSGAPPTGPLRISGRGRLLAGIAVLLVAVLAMGNLSGAEPSPTPQPSPAPQPVPQPAPGPDDEPQAGGLRDLVQEQVGPFQLRDVQADPTAAQWGALDALLLTYAAPDGMELWHELIVWPDPDDSLRFLQEFHAVLLAEGWMELGQIEGMPGYWMEAPEPGGSAPGAAPEAATALIWSNGQLTAIAEGVGQAPLMFAEAAPY